MQSGESPSLTRLTISQGLTSPLIQGLLDFKGFLWGKLPPGADKALDMFMKMRGASTIEEKLMEYGPEQIHALGVQLYERLGGLLEDDRKAGIGVTLGSPLVEPDTVSRDIGERKNDSNGNTDTPANEEVSEVANADSGQQAPIQGGV